MTTQSILLFGKCKLYLFSLKISLKCFSFELKINVSDLNNLIPSQRVGIGAFNFSWIWKLKIYEQKNKNLQKFIWFGTDNKLHFLVLENLFESNGNGLFG